MYGTDSVVFMKWNERCGFYEIKVSDFVYLFWIKISGLFVLLVLTLKYFYDWDLKIYWSK